MALLFSLLKEVIQSLYVFLGFLFGSVGKLPKSYKLFIKILLKNLLMKLSLCVTYLYLLE